MFALPVYGFELHCDDSARWLKTLPSNYVDLTVTSPPYDGLRAYNGYSFDFETVAAELWRVTKPGGVVVWVVGDATEKGDETGTSFRQALYFKSLGFRLHDTMIYEKKNPIPRQTVGVNRCEQAFEFMFVFSKGKPKTANIERVPCKTAGRTQTGSARDNHSDSLKPKRYVTAKTKVRRNVWSYAVGVGDEFSHKQPATFPEDLAKDHVLTWSNAGDLVLDPFMGAGTVGKECALHDRRFIGCDISVEYVNLSYDRIKAFLPTKEVD